MCNKTIKMKIITICFPIGNCAFYLVYNQIWLNFFRDNCQFFCNFPDDHHFDYIEKFLKKTLVTW